MSTDTDLQISPEAATFLKAQIDTQSSDVCGVRVEVAKAGCSGYEYILDFAKEVKSSDVVFADKSVQVVIDESTYDKFLKGGTVVTYKKKGVQGGIHFDNPNVEAECGCGESFTLKTDNN